MKLTDNELERLLKNMSLEEPSMSFTRNLMEQIKLEIVPVSLKTKVDKRIIYCIISFFALCILTMVVYVVINTRLSYKFPEIEESLNEVVNKTITSSLLKGFLLIDLVIGLIYMDRFLRRKQIKKI